MSTQPRIEARVSAQERRQINLDARIEELSEDTTASIRQLSNDMTTSFKQLAEYLTTLATKEDTSKIKEDISEIKATIATNNENMLLLLTQILDRLPKSEN